MEVWDSFMRSWKSLLANNAQNVRLEPKSLSSPNGKSGRDYDSLKAKPNGIWTTYWNWNTCVSQVVTPTKAICIESVIGMLLTRSETTWKRFYMIKSISCKRAPPERSRRLATPATHGNESLVGSLEIKKISLYVLEQAIITNKKLATPVIQGKCVPPLT